MNPWLPVSALALGSLAGGVIAARWAWRTKFKRSYLFGLGAMIFPAPGRISLEPLALPDSGASQRVANRAGAFRELGFVDLAAYSVNELAGAKLHALRHPEKGLVALIHEHPCTGTWSDVMRFSSTDEPPILASNTLKHAHFQCLPGDPKFHHADVPEAELIRVVESARAHSGAAQAVDAQSFARLCERAYADAADERFGKLPTENEIRRLIKDVSPEAELNDAEIGALRAVLPELIANDWRISCLREFVNGSGLSAREWQQSRHRILVLHDHTPLRELNACRMRGVFITPCVKKRLKRASAQTPPREEFARLNATLPASERYKKLGSIARPVTADIYRACLPGGIG